MYMAHGEGDVLAKHVLLCQLNHLFGGSNHCETPLRVLQESILHHFDPSKKTLEALSSAFCFSTFVHEHTPAFVP